MQGRPATHSTIYSIVEPAAATTLEHSKTSVCPYEGHLAKWSVNYYNMLYQQIHGYFTTVKDTWFDSDKRFCLDISN